MYFFCCFSKHFETELIFFKQGQYLYLKVVTGRVTNLSSLQLNKVVQQTVTTQDESLEADLVIRNVVVSWPRICECRLYIADFWCSETIFDILNEVELMLLAQQIP
jgi:hypothetical protein